MRLGRVVVLMSNVVRCSVVGGNRLLFVLFAELTVISDFFVAPVAKKDSWQALCYLAAGAK